jgi:hypothetical protein
MNDWPEGERRGERAGPAHTASRRRNWIGSAVGPSDGLVEASAKGGFGRRTRFSAATLTPIAPPPGEKPSQHRFPVLGLVCERRHGGRRL